MSALFAAGCVLLGALALWELLGARGEGAAEWARRRLEGRSRSLLGLGSRRALDAIERRLAAASLDGQIKPETLLLAKPAAALLALPAALGLAPVAPGRLEPLLLAALPAAAFMAPDLAIAVIARRRRERIEAALPDALDLMATAAASGRGAAALLAEALAGASGPLREELARAVAAIESGVPLQVALERLGRRGRGEALAALSAVLERSRRRGSPLSDALHEQAEALRGEGRRRIGERAARAAPKMQLVVALLLVPSVMLALAAAIVANSGSLLPGL